MTPDLEEILTQSPELPSKKKLSKLKFKDNGKLQDKNLQTRFKFIKALYPRYQPKDKKLVKYLLKQEIKYAQVIGNYNAGLNLSAFMLYTIMSVKDSKTLYDAKFRSCPNACQVIDIELVFGLDKETTKQYFTEKPDEKRNIVGIIKAYETKPFRSREEYTRFYIEKQIQALLSAEY